VVKTINRVEDTNGSLFTLTDLTIPFDLNELKTTEKK
jgi:hypothetical protein